MKCQLYCDWSNMLVIQTLALLQCVKSLSSEMVVVVVVVAVMSGRADNRPPHLISDKISRPAKQNDRKHRETASFSGEKPRNRFPV